MRQALHLLGTSRAAAPGSGRPSSAAFGAVLGSADATRQALATFRLGTLGLGAVKLPELPNTAAFSYFMLLARGVNVETEVNQAVVYAGEKAQTFASTAGTKTIEMTEGGKLFDDLKLLEPGSPLTEPQARAVWDTLSARFAADAKGQV